MHIPLAHRNVHVYSHNSFMTVYGTKQQKLNFLDELVIFSPNKHDLYKIV
jgi:hypothetical protein